MYVDCDILKNRWRKNSFYANNILFTNENRHYAHALLLQICYDVVKTLTNPEKKIAASSYSYFIIKQM